MIKNKSMTIFMLGLCPLIPAAANFAYGLILACTVWILFFSGLLAGIITDALEIGKANQSQQKIKYFFVKIFIIAAAAFFNFLLQGLFPIVQGPLQIYIYITGFSYIIVLSLENYYSNVESLEFPAGYSILILIISFLREFFAFGTVSLPSSSGFASLKFPYFSVNPPMRFLGTAAGAFILLGLASWIFLSVKRGSVLPFGGSKE